MYTALFPINLLSETLHEISDKDLNFYKNSILNESLSIPFFDGKESKEHGNYTDDIQILNQEKFKPLKNIIKLKVKNYLKEIYKIEHSIDIINSWGNVTNKSKKIVKHHHVNSFISGCFYFNYDSKFNLYDPYIDQWMVGFESQTKYTISPSPKLLVLFPSWINHDSDISNNTRVSLAFDIILRDKNNNVIIKKND